MNYIVKSKEPFSLPETRNGIYGVQLVIKTGIVNQTYQGFENVDCNPDTFCPILRTDNTDEAEIKFTAFATAYVLNKYPNT